MKIDRNSKKKQFLILTGNPNLVLAILPTDNFPNNIEMKSESTRRDCKADAMNVMVWLTSSYGGPALYTIVHSLRVHGSGNF